MTCLTSWPSPLSFKQKITGSNPVHVTISRAISRPTLPGVVILRYAQNLCSCICWVQPSEPRVAVPRVSKVGRNTTQPVVECT